MIFDENIIRVGTIFFLFVRIRFVRSYLLFYKLFFEAINAKHSVFLKIFHDIVVGVMWVVFGYFLR